MDTDWYIKADDIVLKNKHVTLNHIEGNQQSKNNK